MSIDVYQPCPCGSGKKLKFCCNDLVSEMAKVRRLQENEQPRLALQTLEHLDQSHPNNPWIATTRASILMQDDQAAEGARILEALLKAHPDHAFAIALFALIQFSDKGYNQARPAIYRAFQRSARVCPDIVSGLAMSISSEMIAEQNYLAARAHMALAMRLAPEADRESVFVRLLELDGERGIAYPLRSVHTLAPYAGDEATKQDAERARRLADIGCWGASAQLYAQFAEKDSQNVAVWQNLGLCRAWSADLTGAAEALHRAARLEGDFGNAVELETLAQLLDQNNAGDRVTVEIVEYPVKSVSKLLTLLDAGKRLARIPVSQSPEQEQTGAAGMYLSLDREYDEAADLKTAGPQDVPNVIGHIGIFDAVATEDLAARALISGHQGESLDTTRRLFEEAAGDEIGPAQPPSDEEMRDFATVSREALALSIRWHFPPSVAPATRERLAQERWREIAHSVWPRTPLAALGGKTPEQAAGDPELKLPLAAALYVLDSHCEISQERLDLAPLAESLKIELPAPLTADDSAPLNAFTAMRLNRLIVSRLADDKLIYVLNRALMIHHSRFLEEVLLEILKRPACLEKIDLNRVYSTLCDIAREQNKIDEALEWNKKGLDHARKQKDAFEAVFRWELRELMLRLRDPGDPELNRVVAHLREYYGRKVPNFEAYLNAILNANGVATPSAADSILASGESSQLTSGGVWTPDTAAAAAGGERKLWVPGQQ